VTLEGETAVLAHVDFPGPFRVGKYGVDVAALERVGVKALRKAIEEKRLVVVDEIGKMECLSDKFKKLLKEILDSEKVLVATIAHKSNGFIAEIKKRGDIKLFEITPSNRESLLFEILKNIKTLMP